VDKTAVIDSLSVQTRPSAGCQIHGLAAPRRAPDVFSAAATAVTTKTSSVALRSVAVQ